MASLPDYILTAPAIADVELEKLELPDLPVFDRDGEPLDDASKIALLKFVKVRGETSPLVEVEHFDELAGFCEPHSLAVFGFEMSKQCEHALDCHYKHYAAAVFSDESTLSEIAVQMRDEDSVWYGSPGIRAFQISDTPIAGWLLAVFALYSDRYYNWHYASDYLERINKTAAEYWFEHLYNFGLDDRGELKDGESVAKLRRDLSIQVQGPTTPRIARFQREWALNVAVGGYVFEEAMNQGFRWQTPEFLVHIVRTIGTRLVAQGLVWGVYDAKDRLQATFSITDEGTLVDPDDNPFTLEEEAIVGIAHPAEMLELLPKWTAFFVDFEIVQPMEQINRLTFTPESAWEVLEPLLETEVLEDRVEALKCREWMQVNKGDRRMDVGIQRNFGGKNFARIEMQLRWNATPRRRFIKNIRAFGAPKIDPKKLAKLPARLVSELGRDVKLGLMADTFAATEVELRFRHLDDIRV